MSIGKKLSDYRKISGLTQQQLGEKLNLSPQAISKWENDLAQPDLTTLKLLANLYSVSVDELLSDAPVQVSNVEVKEELEEKTKATLGFCKKCGIIVNEDNLGKASPIVICKKCYESEIKAEENRKAVAKAKAQSELYQLKKERNKSLIVAAVITAVYLVILISSLVNKFDIGLMLGGIVLGYAIFSLVCTLFYDTFVSDMVFYMCTASVKWPGLIFTFDLDGFLWVICMKIIFAILGFIIGIACAALGIFLGLVVSPFVFPYVMVKRAKEIKVKEI